MILCVFHLWENHPITRPEGPDQACINASVRGCLATFPVSVQEAKGVFGPSGEFGLNGESLLLPLDVILSATLHSFA